MNLKIISLILGMVVLVSGLYFLLPASTSSHSETTPNDEAQSDQSTEPSTQAVAYYSSREPDDFSLYTNPDYGFSFPYLKDFAVSESDIDGGKLVLLEHPEHRMGFQILITPFDEDPADLTPERIQRELPDLAMKDAVSTYLGDGTPAVRFASTLSTPGDLREAWFVHGGYLYQVTMNAPDQELLDAWILELMNNWRFDN